MYMYVKYVIFKQVAYIHACGLHLVIRDDLRNYLRVSERTLLEELFCH